MASAALRELQLAVLPAAIGTIGVVYSNIVAMGIMGKVRYAEKSKEVHPYKPWADKSDSAEPHFRAFKACQNCTEWTVYVLPVLWLYALYVPAIPVVGKFLPWSTSILGLAFGHFNTKYVEGYIVSAEGRLKPFYRRTLVMRCLFYGTLAGLASAGAAAFGLF